jgi:hypothetical protein
LIPLPKIDERNGKFVHRFASSSAFIDFIAKSVHIANSHEDYGPVLLHCLLALVNITTEARSDTVELLLQANVFNSFAAVPSLRIPLISLLSRLPSAQVVVPILGSPPRARRPDKSRILQQFANDRERFESMHEFDAESGEGGIVCVACHEPIDVHDQLFGFLWTGFSLYFCGHIVHLRCCWSPTCEVCRIAAGLFTQILLPGFTETQRRALRPTIDFLRRNDFAAVVERVGQLLDLEMPLLDKFVQLIQSVIFGLDEFDAEQIADQPLLLFASLLPLATNADHFEWLTTNLWKGVPCPLKSAGILWNCAVQFRRTNLQAIDVSAFKAPLPDYYLLRLPEHFNDFFLPECRGDELKRFKRMSIVCRCLKCGLCIGLGTAQDALPGLLGHATTCGLGLFLCIVGQAATTVIPVCRSEQHSLTSIRALYVTEDGDEDVGLVFSPHLVLSRDRVSALMKDVIMGMYDVLETD